MQNPAQQACYMKIAGWMDELFGDIAWEQQGDNGFRLFMGSAWVEVLIMPFQNDAVIHVRSTVVDGVEASSSLQAFLLHKNAELLFGGFAIDPSGNILFRHSIVGSTCDPIELKTSVENVLATADLYDDRIVDLWGGQRALDRPTT
ncbi:MAG: YbjN domain-containing protein [Cyanobacteria bacterium J06641_5]